MLSITKKEVVDGLLGKLPSEKEAGFLATCFSTDENAEKFEIIRENLIENYLIGMLSPEDKMRFDNHFLLNPHHRQLFEFAKSVRVSLQLDSSLEKIVKKSRVIKTFSVSSLLIPIGGLATILLGAFLVWQFAFKSSNDQKVQTNPTPSNTFSNSKPLFPSDNTQSPETASNTAKVENSIMTFTLPTITKGWKNSELIITYQTKEIKLITTQPSGEFSAYQIKLEKNGRILWEKDFDSFVSYEKGNISINIPAVKLQNGEHRFIILGKNVKGKFEEIKESERIFNVSK